MNKPSSSREILSVSGFTRQVRLCLEQNFGLLWIEGELSNFSRHSSGHWYFSLKDQQAQLRAAMFRSRNRLVKFQPKQGDHVLVLAKAGLYEARGEFQIVVEHMEPAGAGALQQQFELLKQKLADEGLFDQAAKQNLPILPRRIGIISSPGGAAIKDVLTVLKRRFAAIPVLVYPTSVQGRSSPRELVSAIKKADKDRQCDVLILARGGGSLEDLWSFNHEQVARAIYHCHIPLVSGVGHETDVTIADFVADIRAPTPSAAAELVSPDKQEWGSRLDSLAQRQRQLILNQLKLKRQTLLSLEQSLQHPEQKLQVQAQRLDDLQQRLVYILNNRIAHKQQLLNTLESRLQQCSVQKLLPQKQHQLQALQQRLTAAMKYRSAQQNQLLQSLCRALEAVSPLATLGRGYAIVKTSSGTIVRSSNELTVGDSVTTQLHQGSIVSTVDELKT